MPTNIRHICTALLLLSLICASSPSRAAPLPLVENERPKARIVIAEDPCVAVQLAVGELNNHIETITGTRLDVVRGAKPVDGPRVLVGASAATRELGLRNEDFAHQEYLIRTAGNDLILMGHDSARKGQLDYEGSGVWGGFDFFEAVGSAYAVYDFLERVCGVRWYLPTELGTVIPKQAALAVGELDIRRRPWSRYRMIYPWRWMPASLYQWDMSSFEELSNLKRLPHREVCLFWLRQRMGGEVFGANHNFLPWPYRFRKSHPEYFAVNADGSLNMKQLNYASEAVKQQVADDILAWHRGHPKDEDGHYRFHHPVVRNPVFPVVPMDNSSWSQDDASQALLRDKADRRIGNNTDRASRYVFTFVADVARRVAEQEPDITISTLAYANYLFPPEDVDFPDNVAVMVCKQHVKARTLDWDKPYYDVIREWRRKVDDVYVWEYYNFPQFRQMNVFPGLVPRRIGRDAARLHELGVEGEFLEYNTAAGFPKVGPWLVNPAKEHLNFYFRLKLLDTLESSIDELLEEYYRLFYGPAADPMRRFFTMIEDTYMDQELLPDGGDAAGLNARKSWTIYCPPKKLEAFADLIQRATTLAAGQSPYRERVALMDAAVFQFMKSSSDRYYRVASLDYTLTCPRLPDSIDLGTATQATTWEALPKTHVFLQASGYEALSKTRAAAGWNEEGLYVRFRCENPGDANIEAAARHRDALEIFGDDCVELFVDANRDRATYRHFAVNAVGSVFDQKRPQRDIGWNSDIQVHVTQDAEAWSVELLIPWRDLGSRPAPGDRWGINFCRTNPYRGGTEYAAWSPTGGSFHRPGAFGVLEFVED